MARNPPANTLPRCQAVSSLTTEEYNEAHCAEWSGEIDNLLVFAGLFSAVVTAFLIDSYKWLLNADSEAMLLPPQVQKRINVYWFGSLILALSSASTAMLCKEWLWKYTEVDRISGSSGAASCIQYQRCRGVSVWQVTGIISAISVLLQFAVVLFFVGMLELVWPLEKTVAITSTITIALVLLFLIFTTLAPSIQYCHVILRRSSGAHLPPQCLYKSPQSGYSSPSSPYFTAGANIMKVTLQI
ncbi:hypothetical protein EDD18DRAFT_1357690 [Armillaria luteobubalina]|uniref:DUF6535 domain-containing protein n=1 Tax=Armillaria luteobubalina TaxID=153913 RepID=A0AA39UTQ0_9AGAR|nr:hypothetical protein EDD18DRAFT_1357690 [Armillaria luteobubalina]